MATRSDAQALRADARRNRDRLVAVASAVVAEQGADASLEEIARRAGVGSATLHRHFRGRQALLAAVFQGRVATLCGLGDDLLADPDAGAALVTWLRAVVAHAATNRGLGAALLLGAGDAESVHSRILAVADRLLTRAQQTGAARREVAIGDLLTLVNGVSLATEGDPDRADRLVSLIVHGVRRPN